jgi:hypothetical protein
MYAAQQDGFHRAYIQRLKMLYQCITPNSRIIFAYAPAQAEGGQSPLVGVIAATPDFQTFASNT